MDIPDPPNGFAIITERPHKVVSHKRLACLESYGWRLCTVGLNGQLARGNTNIYAEETEQLKREEW